MTEEHIVADWVLRAFLRTKKPRSDFNGSFVGRNRLQIVSGEPISTAKVVCRPCNNEWLSRIDEAAANALKPLIQGRTQVSLNPDAQTAVAAWIFKSALTFDALQSGEEGTMSPLRAAFTRERAAPPGCTIYVGPAPPVPFTVPGVPEVAGLALFGVRSSPGTANLTINVKQPDGTTTALSPRQVPTPGWTVMLGRMNAIISGRRGPIIPRPEWGFQCVWPASAALVTLTSVPPSVAATGRA